MVIVAAVRARDEEANIARFCEAYYQWVDWILVADGGSEDATVEIANRFPKVRVLDFEGRVEGLNGHWRNPHGKHINFLIDKALVLGADWIIFDDCDCVPNFVLRGLGRHVIRDAVRAGHGCINVERIYFWGEDSYFPKLNLPGPSLWAWNAHKLDIRASEDDPWRHEMLNVPERDDPIVKAMVHPMVLLHRSWPTPESVEAKLRFYRESGQHPAIRPPLEFGGEPEPVKDYMRDHPVARL